MTVQKPGDNNEQQHNETTLGGAFGAGGVGNGEQAQTGRQNHQRQSGGGRSGGGRPRQQSVLDINTSFARPVSRRTSGEQVVAFEKALRKEIDASMGENYRDNFNLLVLNNATNQTLLSSILVVLAVKVEQVEHALVFNLIVEGSGPRRDNKIIPINGQNVEVEWVPGDVAGDRVLWDKIVTLVNQSYGREMVTHYVGATVLPVELSAEDADHIHRVVFVTTQALFTAMENEVIGSKEFITVEIVEKNTTVSATLDPTPAPMTNAVGQPVRNDIQITLRGTVAGAQNQGGYNDSIDLTRVAGFVDLVYAEKPAPVYGQPPVTQSYYPRYVMTHLDSEVDAITPELSLLALSSATLLARNMQWAAAFQPRYGLIGKENLRDIGAIGFECNISGSADAKPERIDTESQSFGLPQLAQLLSATVHDNLAFSLDVEEVGEMTWLQQMFLAAAYGDTDAYMAIVEASNNLTLGHFGRGWNNNAPIVFPDNNRIHLGWYKDPTGQVRDIREIDYLAMLNLWGSQDLNVAVQWSDTFLKLDRPDVVRLETRTRILKNILTQADFRIKGFANRVNFAPEFLGHLANSCAAAGLSIRQNNPFQAFTGTGGRGVFAGGQLGVNGQQIGAMFNYGAGNNYGTFRGFSGPSYGRFGGNGGV